MSTTLAVLVIIDRKAQADWAVLKSGRGSCVAPPMRSTGSDASLGLDHMFTIRLRAGR